MSVLWQCDVCGRVRKRNSYDLMKVDVDMNGNYGQFHVCSECLETVLSNTTLQKCDMCGEVCEENQYNIAELMIMNSQGERKYRYACSDCIKEILSKISKMKKGRSI